MNGTPVPDGSNEAFLLDDFVSPLIARDTTRHILFTVETLTRGRAALYTVRATHIFSVGAVVGIFVKSYISK